MFQREDDVVRVVRREQSGHILEQILSAPISWRPSAFLDEVVDGIDGTTELVLREGVTDGGLHMLATRPGRLHRCAQIPLVIQCIEDAKDVDTTISGMLHERTHHIIRIVAVADQVLPPEQHLQWSLRRRPLEEAQSLPRVLIEEPRHDIERGATILRATRIQGCPCRVQGLEGPLFSRAWRAATDGHLEA